MSNWPELSIEQLKASSKNAIAMGPFGSRIKADNFVKNGVPIIKGGNLNGDFISEEKFDYLTDEKATELKTSNAFRRDIVITHRGTIGQVGIIPDNSKHERYVVSQSQLKVTLDQDKVNPYFVYYFLRSPLGQHRLLVNASQVGVPAIAQASTSVKAILVPCPDKNIQDKVVEILLNLDHKIELNRQTNQTLEQIAQAIFKSWFVDFEPVKAKIKAKQNGQDPELAAMCTISGKTEEQLKDLDDATLQQLKTTVALFPDALVESELGEIPKGWEVKPLSNVAEIVMGQSPKGDTYNDIGEGTPLVNGPVEFGSYHTKKTKWTTSPTRLSSARDLIVCVRGSTTGRYVKSDGEYCLGRGVCAIRSPENQPYIDYLFKREISNLLGLTTGSTFPSWNGPVLKSYEIVRPTDEVMDAFSKLINSIELKISITEAEIEQLASLRDTLLPQLLSGILSTDKAA